MSDWSTSDWSTLNREMWDERVAPHAASPDYQVTAFTDDPAHLSEVVRFDLPRLGDVRGLDGVHLQCHIGTDTVSLARLGARMTGLDFSALAVEQAQRLADTIGADARFVQSDLYAAREVLPVGGFDLVYTGIGALCWLPDIAGWARLVADLLRPGGRLFLREGHPVLLSLDETHPDALTIGYPYFTTAEPLIFDEPGTYVATEHEFVHTRSASWNHGLGEVVTALLDAGLRLSMLVEHESVPWDALPGQLQPIGGGEYRLRERPERLPHTYTLQAVKDTTPG